jgi:hypothetical protein
VDGSEAAVQVLAQLVAENGGAVAKRMTPTVRLVVAADPAAPSSQLERAREFGIPILHPSEAHEHLQSVLDAAAAAERARQVE